MKTRVAALGALMLVLVLLPSVIANTFALLSVNSAKQSPDSRIEIASPQTPLLAMTLPASPATRHASLVVSSQGPYITIHAALAAAHAGDEIVVQGGVYRGALIVDKPVKLTGVNYPMIDGEGRGTVVTLSAEGAELRGFEVRGSGLEYDNDHSGIMVTAPRVVVENNRLRDVLFGVVVFQAADSIVRGNDISGKSELDVGVKGDGIRLWYSPRTQVVENHVHESRDVVIWYSAETLVRDNLIEHGRYGLHLMYCNDSIIERNRILSNSVGIYSMFSNDIVVRENLIRGQRGPSGYALGFKDTDNLEAANNVLVDNRAGVYLDGTPFSPQGFSHFHDNVLAFNDVGVIALPAVRGNIFAGNSFWENVEQVAVQGGGLLGSNQWRGNFWSDYAGFDANGDGAGDMPYRAERFFENMIDREPYLRALLYSPAAQALEFAATSFPIVKPQPKFTDPTPRVDPISIPLSAASASRDSGPMAVGAMGLLALGVLLGVVAGGGSVKRKAWSVERGSVSLRGAARPSPIGDASLKATKQAPSRDLDAYAASHKPLAMTQAQSEIASHKPLAMTQAQSEIASHKPLAMTQARSEIASHKPLAMTRTSVRAESVTKQYGKVKALDIVSFTARAGEAIALWGPNGAGKTTLIKAILGLIDFQGEIWVQDQNVRRAGKAARRNIGYVPQEAIFYDWGVQATMEFYARLKGVGRGQTGQGQALPLQTRIAQLLERLGLADHAQKSVGALSGGLKQRLALAIALLADPLVLLFDEPTASLDARARSDYLALVAALRKEDRTIIFASHRLEEVEALADRVLVLEAGRLIGVMTPEELRARLLPEVEMALWIPEPQRVTALAQLLGAGLDAHFNGRGTVVVRVPNDKKIDPLHLLSAQGITVTNFEIETGRV